MRYECCYIVRAKGLFKSHFKLNRNFNGTSADSTPHLPAHLRREFRERDIKECNFWLTAAALLNLEMAILISVLSGTNRLYLPTSEQVFLRVIWSFLTFLETLE